MRFFSASIALVALLLLQASCSRVKAPLQYLIPLNYVGWVSVRCDVDGAPPLEVIEGKIRIEVPASGRVRTSSVCESGLRFVQYWYVDNKGSYVKKLRENSESGIGVFRVTTVGPQLGKDGLSGTVFWVGHTAPNSENEKAYQELMDSEYENPPSSARGK